MNRGQCRGLLFDHLQDRLMGTHRLRVGDVVRLFERKHPDLYRVLEQAHDGGNRSTVDWQVEGRAIDELGRLFDQFSVGRTSLRKVLDKAA